MHLLAAAAQIPAQPGPAGALSRCLHLDQRHARGLVAAPSRHANPDAP